jgi:pyruvate formate lyase activating enzyme
VWIEVSTPPIPGVNDDDASVREMARRIAACGRETPWHLLRFHPDYRPQDALPTHLEILARAVAIAEDAGLRHVYVERALGEARRATRCPGCQPRSPGRRGGPGWTLYPWSISFCRLVVGAAGIEPATSSV